MRKEAVKHTIPITSTQPKKIFTVIWDSVELPSQPLGESARGVPNESLHIGLNSPALAWWAVSHSRVLATLGLHCRHLRNKTWDSSDSKDLFSVMDCLSQRKREVASAFS
jgi:hypothetical protein